MKFEYKFQLNLDPFVAEHTDEELNKLGKEGWELIAVSQCGKDDSYFGYWFKRPLGSK